MLYKGNDTKEERNMDKRYIRIYHDQIRKNREEVNQTEIAHEWAKRKSRIAKVAGLSDVAYNEMIDFASGAK